MAKKLSKLFLFSAAVGAVVGSAYYYYQHKDSILKKDIPLDDEDDFDDFSEDLDEEPNRSYVDIELESIANAENAENEQTAEEPTEKEEKAEKNDREIEIQELKAELSQKAGVVAEKVLEKTADALSAAAGKISETAKALDNAMNGTEVATEEFFDDEV